MSEIATPESQGPSPRKSPGELERNQAAPCQPSSPEYDLSSPEYYLNRELSQLAFNQRVLDQAADTRQPLLERLRFLCIASSNLDEFFQIRVAGLKRHKELGTSYAPADRNSASEVLAQISKTCHELVDDQYELLNDELLPALKQEGIRFLRRGDWTPAQREWIRHYFDTQVLPTLTPIRLDPAHPFPKVLNQALHYIITLEGEDAFGNADGKAVLMAPRVLPRVLPLPKQLSDGDDFVFLTSVIHAHVDELFPGMKVTGCYQFRVTRDSDLLLDEDDIEDLKSALQGELTSRRFGEAVRLEVVDNCPSAVREFLLARFDLGPDDLYRVAGPVNLNRLVALPDQVDRADLKYTHFTQGLPQGIASQGTDLFERISGGDVLLHHPFQSFSVVLDFVRQAVADPNVVAIKQTLYRAGAESALEDLLYNAALAGKEVTVAVELRARFDEAENISLADRLQSAGAHVVYGVVGYKTHAKMLMIVRREGDRLKRYAHVATGNYHAKTARLYTDIGLLTADPDVCHDVHQMFMQLTSICRTGRLHHLLQSPFTLADGLLEKTEAEIKAAKAGRPARIIAKMNSLVDPNMIRALYRASMAGVEIDLIVRGICCLRPGLKGISENIRVRSVVGRFLEHTRVFYFENGGVPEVFCSSADWMPRNLYKRIEACFPILDAKLRAQVAEDGLMTYLRDDSQTWHLQADGTYRRAAGIGETGSFGAQQALMEKLGGVPAP